MVKLLALLLVHPVLKYYPTWMLSTPSMSRITNPPMGMPFLGTAIKLHMHHLAWDEVCL